MSPEESKVWVVMLGIICLTNLANVLFFDSSWIVTLTLWSMELLWIARIIWTTRKIK